MATNLQSEAVPAAPTKAAAGKRALSRDVFTLWSLFVWMTVIAVAFALYRLTGAELLLFAFPLVLVAWLVELSLKPGAATKPYPTVFGTLLPLAGLVTILSLPLALVSMQRSTPHFPAHVGNNLKQVGLAIRIYEIKHSSWPPVVVTDATGQPVHSWRVTIGPEIGNPELPSIYSWREPWDGPNNSQYHDLAIPGLQYPQSPRRFSRTDAAFLAVDVPGGYPDGRFIVVEVPNSGINVFEPRDITLTELGMPGFQGGQRKGTHTHVLWLDGSVELVPVDQLVPRILKYMDQQRAEQVRKSKRAADDN